MSQGVKRKEFFKHKSKNTGKANDTIDNIIKKFCQIKNMKIEKPIYKYKFSRIIISKHA